MTPASSPSRGRNLWRLAIGAACLIGIAWVVVRLGPDRVAGMALEARPGWLALSVVPLGLRFGTWGFKFRRMLGRARHDRDVSPVGWFQATRMLIAGTFVNHTTPTAKVAGGFVRADLLRRRHGWEFATAYGWAFADQITNVIGHGLLFGLLALAFGLSRGMNSITAIGAAAVVGVASFLVLRRTIGTHLLRAGRSATLQRLVPQRFRGDGTQLASTASRILGPLLIEGPTWRTTAIDVLLAAVSFSMLILSNGLVLHALAVEAPWLTIALITIGGYGVGVLIGAWGGIGVTEAALTTLGVHAGLALDDITAATLLHRALFYMVVFAGGGAAYWWDSR